MVKVKFTELTEQQRRNAIVYLAHQYLTIKDCKKCGYPRVDGYCCQHCNDFNPDMTYEQEVEQGLRE